MLCAPPPPEKPPWQMPERSSQVSRSHLGLQSMVPSALRYSVKQGGHWHSCSLMASSGLPVLAASCSAPSILLRQGLTAHKPVHQCLHVLGCSACLSPGRACIDMRVCQ